MTALNTLLQLSSNSLDNNLNAMCKYSKGFFIWLSTVNELSSKPFVLLDSDKKYSSINFTQSQNWKGFFLSHVNAVQFLMKL